MNHFPKLPVNMLLLACMALMSAPSAALSAADFSQCKTRLADQALTRNLDTAFVSEVMETIAVNPRVIQLDRNQPEFVATFSDYYQKRVNDWRVTKGRELLITHQQLLENLEASYGVPAQYLVAFWGLETNYGGYRGNNDILNSLATLACDNRRSDFFSREFVNAMQLLHNQPIARDEFKGSWAGAMGHTQFMPSTYLRYAIDGNNNQTIDLFNEIEDALSSAANFLNQLGWQAGYRWGREVVLPEDFDFATYADSQHPLTLWHELGITDHLGTPIAELDIAAKLLLPTGADGPAFLTYRNFDIIMRWNASEFYALSVGRLADRINGAGELYRPLPDLPKLSTDEIKSFQQVLNAQGFDVGAVDGILGPSTRRGILEFQRGNELVADGFLSNDTISALRNLVKGM